MEESFFLKGWPSDRERVGSPVKPPRGALFSRQGIERCGKGGIKFYQVRFKEVKEMRLNHRRGIVNSLVILEIQATVRRGDKSCKCKPIS